MKRNEQLKKKTIRNMKTKKKCTLHIYWDDDVTVEQREFPSKNAAESYAKDNGIVNYMID